jgi:hypothetical protein
MNRRQFFAGLVGIAAVAVAPLGKLIAAAPNALAAAECCGVVTLPGGAFIKVTEGLMRDSVIDLEEYMRESLKPWDGNIALTADEEWLE